MQEKLIIGMMSGTSVDGIDAALVRFHSKRELELVDTAFYPFQTELKHTINTIALDGQLERCEDSELHQQLAHHYANAALSLTQKAKVEISTVDAIANHGQTVRHEPNASPPFSLQLGDPQIIADTTGITTVGNFRQTDLAAGGQGAPLMPAFHEAVLGGKNRFLINIGGIANITHLGETVIGFDTGPGNTLMDQWILKNVNRPYDADGAWADSGKVIDTLLNRLLSDPYFNATTPKSTGTDYFNLEWLGDVSKYEAQDVQATLLAVTVQSISRALLQLEAQSGEVYVCGGGAHNKALMRQLQQALPSYSVQTTDRLGISADWVEAIGFAWLGYCRLTNLDSNLPSVTGARHSLSLGEIFHPSVYVTQ